MTIIVGCKLPFGHTIEHNGEIIALNGSNVGYDPDNPWKSDNEPDSALRASGAGLTTLEGAKEDAFKDWAEMTDRGDGPVKSGAIFWAAKETDARREAINLESEATGLDGIDPSKDLPKGLETDTETAKKG